MNLFNISTNKFFTGKVHYILCLKNNILIHKDNTLKLINSLGIVDKEFIFTNDEVNGIIYFNDSKEKIKVQYKNNKIYKTEDYVSSILQNNSIDSFNSFTISKHKKKGELSNLILSLRFPLYCISDASGELVLIYIAFKSNQYILCIFKLDSKDKLISKYIYSNNQVIVDENIDF